jgi:aminoglycoside phosphotransferase (APT) family kinase protein
MDWDDRVELDNNASFLSWIRKYDEVRENQLAAWVSTFHVSHLPFKLATHKLNDSRGAFNINCKVEFDNGEKWMVRFPMVGKIINADEKVEIEVATINLIRQRTTIPVPEVKVWGLAAENPLGLGPFMMVDFVEGISVDNIFQTPDARIMRQGVSERVLEVILRQAINFLLQIHKLDFPCIGSLTSASTISEDGFAATIHSRPLPKKSHEYLLEGGGNVLSM